MKGQFVEVIKRQLPLDKIASISLRYKHLNLAKEGPQAGTSSIDLNISQMS